MKITHKMSVSDKLREILWVTKWKQKDLAGKFHVSAKTISFWITTSARRCGLDGMTVNIYEQTRNAFGGINRRLL